MGHDAGWLALGAGLAGGADVILIPEIPHDLEKVAEHLIERRRHGKRFSIIAVAEGARSVGEENGDGGQEDDGDAVNGEVEYHPVQEPKASRITRELQKLTGIEARVTSLGHVQRGGAPTATDRLYSTLLGTKAAELLAEGTYNVMVAIRNQSCKAVDLEKVAGKTKLVPADHPWVTAARLVGTCFGD
jgi:6-phosphofructokinase 1